MVNMMTKTYNQIAVIIFKIFFYLGKIILKKLLYDMFFVGLSLL